MGHDFSFVTSQRQSLCTRVVESDVERGRGGGGYGSCMKLLRVFMVDGWRPRRLQSVDLCLFKLFSTKKLLKKGGEKKGRWNRTKVTAIYRNICLRLQVVRRHLHSHSHSHRHNLTQLSVRLHVVTPPAHPSRSIVPASPSIHVNHLGRLSERVELSSQLSALPVLGTRHSTLGYEINDFSANFQQFAFWPRPGTARQPHQQIESRRKLFD